jgi:hypothetical protein
VPRAICAVLPAAGTNSLNGTNVRLARSSIQLSQNEKSLPRILTATAPVSLLPAAYIMLLRSAFSAGPHTTFQDGYCAARSPSLISSIICSRVAIRFSST